SFNLKMLHLHFLKKIFFMKISLIPLFLFFCVFSGNSQSKNQTISVTYPETKKDNIVDTYFGVEVKDPYRWLEDDRSAETAAWVKAENKVTYGYLEKIPFRKELKNRLTKLWNYEKV